MKHLLHVIRGFTGVCLALLLFVPTTLALAANPSASNNWNAQDYGRCSDVVNSYLYDNSNGTFMRVEHGTKENPCEVTVEIYDSKFELKSKKYISDELSIFGGFYSGKTYNYLVYGQNNDEESAEKEIMRVVRYSKDWERLDDCKFKDINTVAPFHAGSLRMIEAGGYLYIRTCHKMYKSDDGLNHQANMTFQIDVSDANKMIATDSQYWVWNINSGYVSHSFNQFVAMDSKGNLIAYDHGDAYPRSNVLIRFIPDQSYKQKIIDRGWVQNVNILEYPGTIGNNTTGGTIGGLEVTPTTYLTVGNYDGYDGVATSGAGNVYVSTTKIDDFTSKGTTLTWLTSYQASSTIETTTPQIVKFSDDLFLVLWGLKKHQNGVYDVNTTQFSYVFVDRNGKMASQVKTATGYLSDCQPIMVNGNAVWYATNGTCVIFQTISKEGTYNSYKKCSVHTWDNGKITTPATCTKDGVKTYTCTECNTTKTEVIKATGHKYSTNWTIDKAPTCTETGSKSRHCTVCGAKTAITEIPKTEHTWDNGKVTIPATCTKDGVKTYTCKACKVTKTVVIKATGHNGVAYVTKATLTKNGKISYICSKCGVTVKNTTIYYPKQISLAKTSMTYNGKTQKPPVTVKDAAGKVLKSTNYTVSYPSGCKYVGKYTVKIVFKGNYSGTVTKEFTILPKGTNITKATPGSKSFTLKWSKQSSQTTGYQIQYCTNSKFSKAKTSTISKNSKVSETIKKLSGKKKYYVRIRTYKVVGSRKYYSGWSKTKTVITKK